MRQEKDGEKKILPLRYCKNTAGQSRWEIKGFGDHFFGQENLRDDRTVVIVEGEKTAKKAQELFPEYAFLAVPGANRIQKLDYSLLKGKDVIIWPDNDKPGLDVVEEMKPLLEEGGAVNTRIIDVGSLNLLKKWDLGDDIPNNLNIRKILDPDYDQKSLKKTVDLIPESVRENAWSYCQDFTRSIRKKPEFWHEVEQYLEGNWDIILQGTYSADVRKIQTKKMSALEAQMLKDDPKKAPDNYLKRKFYVKICKIWQDRNQEAKDLMVNDPIFESLKEKDEYYKNSVAKELVDHKNLYGENKVTTRDLMNIFERAEQDSKSKNNEVLLISKLAKQEVLANEKPEAFHYIKSSIAEDISYYKNKILNLYKYKNINNRVIGYVVKIKDGGRIKFKLLTCSRNQDGKISWNSKDDINHFFGQENLKDNRTVLIVKGEEEAKKAQELFPEYAVIGFGQTYSIPYMRCFPLKGKDVIIWPENDRRGLDAAEEMKSRLEKKGVYSLKIIDVKNLNLPPKTKLTDIITSYSREVLANEKTMEKAYEEIVLTPREKKKIIEYCKNHLFMSEKEKNIKTWNDFQKHLEKSWEDRLKRGYTRKFHPIQIRRMSLLEIKLLKERFTEADKNLKLSNEIDFRVHMIWKNREKDAKDLMANDPIFESLKGMNDKRLFVIAKELADHKNIYGKNNITTSVFKKIMKIKDWDERKWYEKKDISLIDRRTDPDGMRELLNECNSLKSKLEYKPNPLILKDVLGNIANDEKIRISEYINSKEKLNHWSEVYDSLRKSWENRLEEDFSSEFAKSDLSKTRNAEMMSYMEMHMLYERQGKIDKIIYLDERYKRNKEIYKAKDLSKDIRNEILGIWKNREKDAKDLMANDPIFESLKEKDEYYKKSVAEQLVDHYNLHGKKIANEADREHIFKIAEKESEFLHKIDNKVGNEMELSRNLHLTEKNIDHLNEYMHDIGKDIIRSEINHPESHLPVLIEDLMHEPIKEMKEIKKSLEKEMNKQMQFSKFRDKKFET